MIDRFGGVIFWTNDLAGMIAFYREVLQLPVHSTRPTFVAFELGGVRISVGTHSDVRGRSAEPVRVMVNFEVDDIAGVYQRLLTRGVTFVRPPEQEHWGGLVATFADPDGNLLQLLQQPAADSGHV